MDIEAIDLQCTPVIKSSFFYLYINLSVCLTKRMNEGLILRCKKDLSSLSKSLKQLSKIMFFLTEYVFVPLS